MSINLFSIFNAANNGDPLAAAQSHQLTDIIGILARKFVSENFELTAASIGLVADWLKMIEKIMGENKEAVCLLLELLNSNSDLQYILERGLASMSEQSEQFAQLFVSAVQKKDLTLLQASKVHMDSVFDICQGMDADMYGTIRTRYGNVPTIDSDTLNEYYDDLKKVMQRFFERVADSF